MLFQSNAFRLPILKSNPKAIWGSGKMRLSEGETMDIINRVVSSRARMIMASDHDSPSHADGPTAGHQTPPDDDDDVGLGTTPPHHGHPSETMQAAKAAGKQPSKGSAKSHPDHLQHGGFHDSSELEEATAAFAQTMAEVPDKGIPYITVTPHAPKPRVSFFTEKKTSEHAHPSHGRHGKRPHSPGSTGYKGSGNSHPGKKGKNRAQSGESPYQEKLLDTPSQLIPRAGSSYDTPSHARHGSSPMTGRKQDQHMKPRYEPMRTEADELLWSHLIDANQQLQLQIREVTRENAAYARRYHQLEAQYKREKAQKQLYQDRAKTYLKADTAQLRYQLEKLAHQRQELMTKEARLTKSLASQSSLPSHSLIFHSPITTSGSAATTSLSHGHDTAHAVAANSILGGGNEAPMSTSHEHDGSNAVAATPFTTGLMTTSQTTTVTGTNQTHENEGPQEDADAKVPAQTDESHSKGPPPLPQWHDDYEDPEAAGLVDWGYEEEDPMGPQASTLPSPPPSPRRDHHQVTDPDEDGKVDSHQVHGQHDDADGAKHAARDDDDDHDDHKKVNNYARSRSSSSSSSSSSVSSWAILPFHNVVATGPHRTVTHMDIRRFLAQFSPTANQDMAMAVLALQREEEVTLSHYPPLYHLCLQFHDPEEFYATWTLALKSLVSDANGKGGRGGARDTPRLGNGNNTPAPPSVPLHPGASSPLIEKIVPPAVAERLRALPNFDRLAAETALFMTAVGVTPEVYLPSADDYEAKFPPGSTEWFNSQQQRRAELRELHLTFMDRVTRQLEQKSHHSSAPKSAVKPATVPVPKFAGQGSHPDYRTYLNEVQQYKTITHMDEPALIPLLPTGIIDPTLKQWLSDEIVRYNIDSIETLAALFEARYNRNGVYDQYLERLLDNLKPQAGQPLSFHLDNFIKIVAQLRRTYPNETPPAGSDAFRTEHRDIERFLTGVPEEDRAWIWNHIDYAAKFGTNPSRYNLLIEAVQAREAHVCKTQYITEYCPIPADGGKANNKRKVKETMMGGVNAIDEHDQNDHADPVLNAIDKLTKEVKKRPYPPQRQNGRKSHDHGKRQPRPTTKPDYIAQADMKKIQNEQLQTETHYPYLLLTVKETNQYLCTYCAHSGHSYRQCPQKDTLHPLREKNWHKRKDQSKQDF